MIDFTKLSNYLSHGEVDCKEMQEVIEKLVTDQNWLPIYLISESVAREVSILIDAEDKIWVDWGNIGEVTLKPPIGATLPFKLWLHTHPRNSAYWSATDRSSLNLVNGILDRALVLGMNGMLSASKRDETEVLVESEQSFGWTEELVKSWFEVLLLQELSE